jgi:Zn-dependent protease
LVHREELERLAQLATAATGRSDYAIARAHWQEALTLLPPASAQHQQISGRLDAITQRIDQSSPVAATDGTAAPRRSWWRRAAGSGAAVGVLLAGKLKLLLLGLTKLSTVVSMFGFVAVYWSLYGWPLAFGIVAAIYVHEMGHVAMLRRFGVHAGAPLFIPGVGALVMLKERVTDPVLDARIGLAGPVWGLSAAIVAWVIYAGTGAPIWLAIAELTGFLNLFNLIPIWQLDGSRGFHALSRSERSIVIAICGVAAWLHGVRLLWIIASVAAFRTVRGEQGPGHRPTLITFAVLIFALSWFARGVG